MSLLNIILLVVLVALIIVYSVLINKNIKRSAALSHEKLQVEMETANLKTDRNAVESMRAEVIAAARRLEEEKPKIEHFSKKVEFPKPSSLSLAKFVVGREIIKDIFAKHPEFLHEGCCGNSWVANIYVSLVPPETTKPANE